MRGVGGCRTIGRSIHSDQQAATIGAWASSAVSADPAVNHGGSGHFLSAARDKRECQIKLYQYYAILGIVVTWTYRLTKFVYIFLSFS
jgi:hypothetical protein